MEAGQGQGLEQELGLGGWIIDLVAYNRIVGTNSEAELESVVSQVVVVVQLGEAGQGLVAGSACQMCGQSS